jgi:hypothetical protein
LGFGRERKDKKNGRENASSSPVLCVSRGRRRLMVPFKTAPFASFFFFFAVKRMKRRRFDQNAQFHLNKNWRRKEFNFRSALHFARFFTMVLGFGFLQSSP